MTLDRLTPAMREAALLAAEGLTTREIAYRLGISNHGACNRLSRLYALLGIHNRVELARWVYQQRGAA